ncbi:MAG: hypothetical protein AAF570_14945, partial [Bacteroidota bacterium]
MLNPNSHSFSRSIISLFGIFLALFLLRHTSVSAQTIYTVNDTYGVMNFNNVRDAFHQLETAIHSGPVEIHIASGVYPEDHFVDPISWAGPGKEILVKSISGNPTDVIFQPQSIFTIEALRLNGVQYMTFEGITFEVAYHPLRNEGHAVLLEDDAGNIAFQNCHFTAFTPPTFPIVKPRFSIVQADLLGGNLSFNNCDLRHGGMGLRIRNTSVPAILDVQNTGIHFILGDGIRLEDSLQEVHVTDGFIHCNGAGKFKAINIAEYAETLEIRDNFITTYLADRATAIDARAAYIDIANNDIVMAEHAQSALGIMLWEHPFDTEIRNNDIRYPGIVHTFTAPDSFIGVS